MRLHLDELISWRIAAELRKAGHDVEAVKRDLPELDEQPDGTALAAALPAYERRRPRDAVEAELLRLRGTPERLIGPSQAE